MPTIRITMKKAIITMRFEVGLDFGGKGLGLRSESKRARLPLIVGMVLLTTIAPTPPLFARRREK